MKMKDMFSPPNSRPSTPPHSSQRSSFSPCPSPPRTFSETLMEENIENAEAIIRRWDLDASTSLYKSMIPQLFSEETDPSESKQFLNAVKDLQNSMHFFIKGPSNSEILIRTQKLMEIAMKRLEREFYTILKTKRSSIDAESLSHHSKASRTSTWSSFSEMENEESSEDDDESETPQAENLRTPNSERDNASEVVMSTLRNIAECMISAGYGKECVYIYKLIRRSIVDETLYYLGVENFTSSQIQKMDWNALEVKVKNWLTAVKTTVRTLFHGERILSKTPLIKLEQCRLTGFFD